MSKQTSVEWFYKWLNDNQEATIQEGNKAFEQAKAMEKEQIIDGFGVGCQVESTRLIGYHKMAEQYYNETYK